MKAKLVKVGILHYYNPGFPNLWLFPQLFGEILDKKNTRLYRRLEDVCRKTQLPIYDKRHRFQYYFVFYNKITKEVRFHKTSKVSALRPFVEFSRAKSK